MDIKLLGAQIKSARKRQGFSLKSLGLKAGVHYTQISRMERGTGVFVSKNVRKVCEILQVPIAPASRVPSSNEGLSEKIQDLIQDWPESEELIRNFIDALGVVLVSGKASPAPMPNKGNRSLKGRSSTVG
ncbi:helix-turn-helix domain-containing protein [Pseudomonas chlororaphis]